LDRNKRWELIISLHERKLQDSRIEGLINEGLRRDVNDIMSLDT